MLLELEFQGVVTHEEEQHVSYCTQLLLMFPLNTCEESVSEQTICPSMTHDDVVYIYKCQNIGLWPSRALQRVSLGLMFLCSQTSVYCGGLELGFGSVLQADSAHTHRTNKHCCCKTMGWTDWTDACT